MRVLEFRWSDETVFKAGYLADDRPDEEQIAEAVAVEVKRAEDYRERYGGDSKVSCVDFRVVERETQDWHRLLLPLPSRIEGRRPLRGPDLQIAEVEK